MEEGGEGVGVSVYWKQHIAAVKFAELLRRQEAEGGASGGDVDQPEEDDNGSSSGAGGDAGNDGGEGGNDAGEGGDENGGGGGGGKKKSGENEELSLVNRPEEYLQQAILDDDAIRGFSRSTTILNKPSAREKLTSAKTFFPVHSHAHVMDKMNDSKIIKTETIGKSLCHQPKFEVTEEWDSAYGESDE